MPKEGKHEADRKERKHRRSSSSSRSRTKKRKQSSSASRSRGSSSNSSASRKSRVEVRPEDEIKVECHDKEYVHKPLSSFSDAEFPSEFHSVFKKLGFSKPTGIQANAIPIANKGIDMVGIARTGSGKTLAFILPALVAILEEKAYYRKKGKVSRFWELC